IDKLDGLSLDGERQFGVKIVKKALEEPIRWIAQNAGHDGSIIVEKVRNGKANFGFDAAKEEYVQDMMKAGIIDPTKVARTALQNAASVASLLLTTEAMVAEKPKEKSPYPPMPPGGGGMEGMY
ncbi:MAG: TCP-1/cpn60 chaperonin family protein, partial [Syntrophorhabdales bacterium]